MLPELTDLADQVNLSPGEWIGIPIALVGAVILSLGAHYQHRGVGKVEASAVEASAAAASNVAAEVQAEVTKGGLSGKQLLALISRPSWLIGTGLLGLAILFQLTSIYFSPLIVVQPLGAIALVVTAILTARSTGIKLDSLSKRAIALCVGGIALFVAITSFSAKSSAITETQLITVLVILGVVLIAFAVLYGMFRSNINPMFYIIGAGVLFGFVATLAKVVIGRIQTLFNVEFQTGQFEWLTLSCVVALLAASALGSYFVQSAYSKGPPDLVVAGLTVIDPIVAITIAIIVLGEARHMPIWAIPLVVLAGAIAVYGVFLLSKHHPQTQSTPGASAG